MKPKKTHKHKWTQTTKWVTAPGILGWLFAYQANINQCKCGEWYYITIYRNHGRL